MIKNNEESAAQSGKKWLSKDQKLSILKGNKSINQRDLKNNAQVIKNI